ncbi:MAG: ABC-2 family transporter protein [Planctomycetia bacterium]|nr:ABC-2 family transporter protein [Planctomycetia bacterium]
MRGQPRGRGGDKEKGRKVRTHWFILKTCISERLAYRGDFAFGTLVRFLPIVSSIFLWSAIYARDSDHEMNGYKLPDMIAYFLLVMVGRAFSSMPGLAGGIARDVRDGTIKKYLTQPVDMLAYLFWARVAHKLVYYFVATGPFVLVFYLCRGYFAYSPDLPTIGAFVLSLVIAFLIGFLMESLIGLISFWFLEVSSLIFIFMMINYFLSGHMAPLPWLMNIFGDHPSAEQTARVVMLLLPFQYLAYFPAALMLGKHTGDDLWQHLAVGAVWVVVLYAANRVMFARGVRRYSAFGG